MTDEKPGLGKLLKEGFKIAKDRTGKADRVYGLMILIKGDYKVLYDENADKEIRRFHFGDRGFRKRGEDRKYGAVC